MQDDLEDQTMMDDESYEDESCKKKKSSELNSSMMSEGIELEEFMEADTDWTSQEESALSDEDDDDDDQMKCSKNIVKYTMHLFSLSPVYESAWPSG